MADITLKNICKNYGEIKAVDNFNLNIADNEFVVLVGPSGCGKTTLLRLIAGLDKVNSGEIFIDGKLVNNLKPGRRSVAMMFQSFALFPHLTVYGNIAFGLRLKGEPRSVIKEKTEWAAELLGIVDCLKRKPHELSGGQKQRTALGRAIVTKPRVFLLDEPLSNLDIKLRGAMREEILRLHEKLDAAFVYVTHDQTEAMTMGNRLVVMKDGSLLQADSPQNVYNHPADKFTAGFVGLSQMNFFDARVVGFSERIEIIIGDGMLQFDKKDACFERLRGYKNLTVGIRPEHVYLEKPDFDCFKLPVFVKRVEDLGSESIVYADLPEGSVAFKAEGSTDIKRGSADIYINKNRLHFFNPEGGKNEPAL